MCQDHAFDEAAAKAYYAPTRRTFLGGVAALGAGLLMKPAAAFAATEPKYLTGQRPFKVATHVHATYSEQNASWEQQYWRAAQSGHDVLCQTDHDHLMTAQGTMHHLQGTWASNVRGSTRTSPTAHLSGGAVTLAIESGNSSPSTVALKISDRTAWTGMRTGIAGLSMDVVFGDRSLPAGGYLDMVVTLSRHPAQHGRPEGVYSLIYRFGPGLGPGGTSGLQAVITSAMPAPGTAVTIRPVQDAASAWPDMLAIDNGLTFLAFELTSPGQGSPASAKVSSVTFNRNRNDQASVRQDATTILDALSAQYGVRGSLAQEVSIGNNNIPHVNPLFAPFVLNQKKGITESNWLSYYAPIIKAANDGGGATSWNHVFGPGGAGSMSASAQTALRRQTFHDRFQDRFAGCTLLEIYINRGHMPAAAFLDLADTFARYGRPITLIGATDDHSGPDWRTLGNGLVTGVHASSQSDNDLANAMNAGRAFGAHLTWTGSHLDTLTDGVPMGGMTVDTQTSRTVAVDVAGLPANAIVELVTGPVDANGEDPGTSVAGSFVANTAGKRDGVTQVTVPTDTGGCFIRPQVRNASGKLIGWGQPTWFLAQPPADGIPANRRY